MLSSESYLVLTGQSRSSTGPPRNQAFAIALVEFPTPHPNVPPDRRTIGEAGSHYLAGAILFQMTLF